MEPEKRKLVLPMLETILIDSELAAPHPYPYLSLLERKLRREVTVAYLSTEQKERKDFFRNDHTLLLSNSPELILTASAANLPCILLLSGKESLPPMDGIREILMSVRGVDCSYFQRCYAHAKQEPALIRVTRRFLIREFEANDFEALYSLFSDPSVAKTLKNPKGTKEEEKEKFYSMLKAYPALPLCQYGIFDRKNHSLLGQIGFSYQSEPFSGVMLGYAVTKSKRRHGVALECIRSVLSYAAGESDLPVFAEVQKQNTASLQLLEKLKKSKFSVSQVKETADRLIFQLYEKN